MRLLAIIEASSITGPAKNLLEFARLGRGAGIETIIGTFTREPGENTFIGAARASGLCVEAIPERGPFDPAAIEALARIAKQAAPDIIQTHAVKSHFLARRAGLPRIAPWVAFHHGYTWPTLKARAYNQLDRWSLRAARRVLTVSLPFRDELASHGVKRDRIEVVHNAITPRWGSREGHKEEAVLLRAKLGFTASHKVILIVGRLSREKDHLTLLESIRPLIAAAGSGASPHLLIVGEGPERLAIERRIAQLGLKEHVTLAGHQPSAEPYYRIADVAVLSSLSEGSPNALLEAMAAGVPIVATNVGGIPEIVTNGVSALLIQPRDVEGMTAALARVLSQEPALVTAMVRRCHKLIEENHSPDKRMRKLLSIYQDVLRSTAG